MFTMEIRNVTIAGGGVLGSQIAWQTAFMGFNVTVYDAFEKGLENCRQLHKKYADLFLTSRGANQEQINQANLRLSYTTDLARAVKDADLISESIPEDRHGRSHRSWCHHGCHWNANHLQCR
jgi:3-hydroxyacyl-CoA dehydrogenase